MKIIKMNQDEIGIELQKLFEICHANLLKSQVCKEYLCEKRGLSLSTIEKFKLGYFPQNTNTLVKYVSSDVLEKLKIIDYSGKSLFSDFFYLIFPIVSEYQEPIGIGGRTLLSEEQREVFNLPKYKNSSFKKANYLYGLDKSRSGILQKQNVFVVEGYFDQISLNVNEINNSVAICGTAFSKNHFLKLARYTNTITFLLDNDDGGQESMKFIYQKYSNYNLNLRFAKIPSECKDVDDYFKNGGNKSTFNSDLKYFSPDW